jgi:hypothetical protein
VWFSETEQKRNSLTDLWEASRFHPASSGRKRSLNNNADYETTRAKRQRLLHDKEAEFKYVSLADTAASLSADQTSSQPKPGLEPVTFDYAMSYINKVQVRIPHCLLKEKSVFIQLNLLETFSSPSLIRLGGLTSVTFLSPRRSLTSSY